MVRRLIFFLFCIPHFVYSSETIYEETINHLVKEIVEKEELYNVENERDSIYNYAIVIGTVDNLLQRRSSISRKISELIEKHKIVVLEGNELANHIDTCKNEMQRIFVMEKLDYCESCRAPFSIRFVECFLNKIDHDVILSYHLVHDFCYTYNCELHKLEYSHCVTGRFNHLDECDFIKRNGFKER